MNRIKQTKKTRSTIKGVLFLQGVYKTDCKKMEDLFQDRLLTEHNYNQDNPTELMTIYDKIPPKFTTMDKWLKQTNILCWHCNDSYSHIPWTIPQAIEPISLGVAGEIVDNIKHKRNKKSVSITPEGLFCSCNCAQAYINTHYRHKYEEWYNRTEMLKYLYLIFTNKKISDIQPSKPRHEMTQFGGDLSRAAYRAHIAKLNKQRDIPLEDSAMEDAIEDYLNNLLEPNTTVYI